MNLAHFLTQVARRFPDEPALVTGEESLTWRQLDARVGALAAGLSQRGIGKGDRVLVHSRNCHEMVETQLASFRLGAVWVPTNYRILPEDTAALAELCSPAAVVVQTGFEDHARAAASALSAKPFVVRIGDGNFGDVELNALVDDRLGDAWPNADVVADDPCWFFLTSGTTGRPKAAVLTHGQMGFVVTNHLCDLMPGTSQETDASIVVAPLSHGAGIHLLAQVARGVKTVLAQQARLDADEIWSLVARHRVTNLFTVPTIVKKLVEDPAVDRYDHSSLRYLIYAGAPMYREDQKLALGKLGKVIVQYFGLGEVTGAITVFPPQLHHLHDGPEARVGTCGFERTAMQVSIQDDRGQELAAGETGEICVCGPAVFAGYYHNPEANAQAFRNGWFRTGDLGHMDAQGFLYITGRATDMYISGGSNIYPREIEEKILAHPQVREVAVIGMPDSVWGEVGVAAVVLRAAGAVSADELHAWMKTRIAGYKVPRRIEFFDELPKSAYGKITKRLVREAVESRG